MILTGAHLRLAAVTVAFCALAGCGAPNKANIKLRKQAADLRGEIEGLKRAQEGHVATINTLERNATTVPVLPGERLERLYSTHGIKFGRLTGGADFDRERPGDEGFKVYVVPTDQDGDIIKAAGSFVVEAFELGREGEVRLGRWEFPLEEAKKLWYGAAMSYGYVLPCPWQTVPQGSEVTIRTTFTDELTRRQFTGQTQIKATPPAQPATNPTVAG